MGKIKSPYNYNTVKGTVSKGYQSAPKIKLGIKKEKAYSFNDNMEIDTLQGNIDWH